MPRRLKGRTALYLADGSGPVKSIPYDKALELVESGMADFLNEEKAIRWRGENALPLGRRTLRSDQGPVYQRRSILKGATTVQGGLCRTEHQPAPIDRFKGATVGHQS